jgi:hypothetical protein
LKIQDNWKRWGNKDEYFLHSKWAFSTSRAKVACDLLNVIVSVGGGPIEKIRIKRESGSK